MTAQMFISSPSSLCHRHSQWGSYQFMDTEWTKGLGGPWVSSKSNHCCSTLSTTLHLLYLLQEDCARILLFRGADKTIMNFGNQDAVQLAQLCGHNQLAQLIQQFSSQDAGSTNYTLI